MMDIQVTLLGNFQIKIDNQQLDWLDSAKKQAFLAYLFLHPSIPISRREMAYRFWPDSSEEQAMANFRNLLFSLRRADPRIDQFLVIRPHSIQLSSAISYQLDVQEFEKLAAEIHSMMDLKKAVQVYAGDFLPDLYDEWIEDQRNRLHGLYIHALECLVQLYEQARDYPNAILYSNRLIENDPSTEKNYRRAMTLHALNNDRASAISVYHRCVEYLRQELDVEPARETKEVYELLLSSETIPTLVATTFPLVGRKEEWRQLQDAWSDTLRRHSQVILLTGEAGIGKTRMAEEMLHWLSKQGVSCASAHCYPFKDSIAFAPLTEWLRRRPLDFAKAHWLVEISRLLPEIKEQQPDLPAPQPLLESWQRQSFFEALAHVMAGDRRPLFLWIDDLHWCDRDTIEWLYFFLRTHPDLRVLILATARAEEMENNRPLVQLVSALTSSNQVTRISLSPFDQRDTSAMGMVISGRPLDHREAVELFQDSEGNPLFIVELMRTQLERGQASASKPANQRDLPSKIHQVIADRLRMVSSPAFQLASLGSVLGRSFTYSVLQGASGIAETLLVDLLDELWRKGIIREHGMQSYIFRHEKIREVIYSSLSQARKRLLHRQVAETLQLFESNSRHSISSQLAFHFEQAGDNYQAVKYYLESANQAARLYANAEAISSLQSGLELLEDLPASPERDQSELSYRLALGAAHLTRQIRAPEVRQNYARAYELAKNAGTVSEQFTALKGLWEYDNYWLSLPQALQLGKVMQTIADQENLPDFQVAARYSLGTTTFLLANLDESRSYLEEALVLLAAQPYSGLVHGVHPAVGCRSRLSWTLCFLGFPDQAIQLGEEAIQIAQDLQHPFSQCSALTLQTFLLLIFGKKQAAGALAEQAIALSEQYDYRFWASSARRMRGLATTPPDQEEAWKAVLARENQEWLNVHQHTPAIWFSISQSLYIKGMEQSGRIREGLERLDAILDRLEEAPELIWKPELLRMKGDLLLQNGSAQETVECLYQQAIQLARAQHSRLLELKAETSLARLWYSVGRQESLRVSLSRLQELIGSFSALDELPDIDDARSLLTRLA